MKYLIAYVAPNDRVLARKIFADSQKEARMIFRMQDPCSEIIAITVLEDEVEGEEYENK